MIGNAAPPLPPAGLPCKRVRAQALRLLQRALRLRQSLHAH